MPAAIPTREPTRIRAGDSLEWDRALSDYLPSDGWSLEYILRAGATVATFDADAAGDHFELRVAAADTENLAPGQYRLIGRVRKDADRRTVHESTVTVQSDPALSSASHAEQMVTKLEADLLVLETGAESWTQGDRAEARAKIAELRGQLSHYREEVRLQRGGPLFVPVTAEFRAP